MAVVVTAVCLASPMNYRIAPDTENTMGFDIAVSRSAPRRRSEITITVPSTNVIATLMIQSRKQGTYGPLQDIIVPVRLWQGTTNGTSLTRIHVGDEYVDLAEMRFYFGSDSAFIIKLRDYIHIAE